MVYDFIVIDDDPVNNRICEIVIRKIFRDASVRTFLEPETGLSYIAGTYNAPGANPVMLLLDINMPTLTGWDVLDYFTKFSEVLINKFTIYILSSSIDAQDKQRASNCHLVSGYIEKPLTLKWIENFHSAVGSGNVLPLNS